MIVRTILTNFIFVAFFIKEVLTGANPGISTTFIGLRNEDNFGHSGYIYLSSESKVEEFQLTTCQNIDINLTTCNFNPNSIKNKNNYLGLLLRAWAATTVRDNILAFLNYLIHQSTDVYNEYTDDSLLFIYQEIKKNNIKMMDLLPGLTSIAKFEKSSQFIGLFKVLEQAMPPFCKSPLDELARFFAKLKYADREHLFVTMKSKGQEMDLYTDIGFQVIPSLRLKSSARNYDKTILASLGREFAILFSAIQEGKIMLTQPVLAVLMLNMRFIELTPDENEDFRFIIDILRSNKISNWSPGFTASANIKCPYELVQRMMKAIADLMKIDPVVGDIAKRMQGCLKKPIRSTIIKEMDAFFSVEQLNIPLIFDILHKILESNTEVNEFQNVVENGTISLSYALKGFNRYLYDSPEKLVVAFVRRVQIRTPMSSQLLQIVSTVLGELKHRIVAEQIMATTSYDIYNKVVKVRKNDNNNNDKKNNDDEDSKKNVVKNRFDFTTPNYYDHSFFIPSNGSTINNKPLTVRNKRDVDIEDAETREKIDIPENLKENDSDEDLQSRRENFGSKDVDTEKIQRDSTRNFGNKDDDSEKIQRDSTRNFGNEDIDSEKIQKDSTRNFGNKDVDSEKTQRDSTRNFGNKEIDSEKILRDSTRNFGNEDVDSGKIQRDSTRNFGNKDDVSEELKKDSMTTNSSNKDIIDSKKIRTDTIIKNFGDDTIIHIKYRTPPDIRYFGSFNADNKQPKNDSFTRNFGNEDPEKTIEKYSSREETNSTKIGNNSFARNFGNINTHEIEDNEKLKTENNPIITSKIEKSDTENSKTSNIFGNKDTEKLKISNTETTTICDTKNTDFSVRALLKLIADSKITSDCPKTIPEHNISAWIAELKISATNIDIIKLVRDVSEILADFMRDSEIHYLVKNILDKFGDGDDDEDKKYDQEEDDGIIVLDRLLENVANKPGITVVDLPHKISRRMILKAETSRKSNNLQTMTVDSLIVSVNATREELLKYLLKNMLDIKKVRARRLVYYEILRIYHLLLAGDLNSKNKTSFPSFDDYPLDEKPTNASLEKFLDDIIPTGLKNYIIELNAKHQLYSIKAKHYKSNRLLIMKLCKILLLQEATKKNDAFFDQIIHILFKIYDFPTKFAALIKFDKPGFINAEAQLVFNFLLEPGLLQLLGSNFDFGLYKTKGHLLKGILETVIKVPGFLDNHPLLAVAIKNYIPQISCREVEAEPALEILEDVLTDQVDVNQVIEQGLKDELLPRVQDAFRGMWIWYGGTFDPIAFMKHLNVSLYDTCADFIEGFLDNLESSVDNDFMKVKSDIRDMRMAISKTGKGKEPVDYI